MNCGFHIDERYADHLTPEDNPERPDRIRALLSAGLSQRHGLIPVASDRRASDDELGRVHAAAHIARIDATAGVVQTVLDWDTHTSAESSRLARLAAGAVLDLVDGVMRGELHRGFAAVRPPGHHAERDVAMGFCLFNNVAVAAAHLLEAHGLERVLVVDPDVHHGNGTQHIFYDDPRVLFVSLHQFPHFPGTGGLNETGVGDGAGYTVNVPLPAGCGDGDYLEAFERVVLPVSRDFKPEFILVSAGIDTHPDDPMGDMNVSDAGFAAMTAALCGLADECADGRLVAVLEGGYDLVSLVSCVDAMLAQLAGAAAAPEVTPDADRGKAVIDQVVKELERRRNG